MQVAKSKKEIREKEAREAAAKKAAEEYAAKVCGWARWCVITPCRSSCLNPKPCGS
jgi:hypothetical protein